MDEGTELVRVLLPGSVGADGLPGPPAPTRRIGATVAKNPLIVRSARARIPVVSCRHCVRVPEPPSSSGVFLRYCRIVAAPGGCRLKPWSVADVCRDRIPPIGEPIVE